MGKKFRRSIEEMPRPAYIFLKWLLTLAAAMLAVSSLLFALGDESQMQLAVLLLETPAGVLLLGTVLLAFLLDHT